MSCINVGLLGFGTLGSKTYQVIKRRLVELEKRIGRPIKVTRIATSCIEDVQIDGSEEIRVDTDLFGLVQDPNIHVVLELLETSQWSQELILEAIRHEKHVVTANTAILAKYGHEIFDQADHYQVRVGFEAAVAGGVPIIKAVRQTLAANQILSIKGIINGVSNEILSLMYEQQCSFDEAFARLSLKSDGLFDIEGIDTAHQLTLLASLSHGIPVDFSKVYVEGISDLALEDVENASMLGFRVKLLGITQRASDGIELRVHPTLVPKSSLFAGVEGQKNAISVVADVLGEVMYYGSSVGDDPLVSSILSDLVEVSRHNICQGSDVVSHHKTDPVLPMRAVRSAYYLRMDVLDKPGVLSDVSLLLAQKHISIRSMVQKEKKQGMASLVFLTHEAYEGDINDAIEQIQSLEYVNHDMTKLRIDYCV